MAGVKYDGDKLRYDLVQWGAIDDLVKVLGMGAKKYSDDNWKQVEDAERRYMAAVYRHLSAYNQGEKVDPESGLSHLAHAMTSLMFLSTFDKGI